MHDQFPRPLKIWIYYVCISFKLTRAERHTTKDHLDIVYSIMYKRPLNVGHIISQEINRVRLNNFWATSSHVLLSSSVGKLEWSSSRWLDTQCRSHHKWSASAPLLVFSGTPCQWDWWGWFWEYRWWVRRWGHYFSCSCHCSRPGSCSRTPFGCSANPPQGIKQWSFAEYWGATCHHSS